MTPQELRASILDLAIHGKLVPQIPEEGTGESLYEQIKMEDAQECSGKRKGKSKNIILPILEEDIPFDVPETWKWVRLGAIGYTNIGLTYSPKDITDDGTIVLRSSNIQNDRMDYEDIVRVKMDIPENKMCHIGDILICARNGSKRLVGKAAIIDKEGMSFGAFMAIFRSTCNEYVLQFINSAYFRNSLLGDTGTTTINQITQDMLKNALIPLPPLAEQKRIVAKIEELLPLIDRYEQAWSKLEEFNKRFPGDMQKSILQLAMQGKLVAQDTNEGNQRNLFKQVQMEYQRSKLLPTISEDEIPYDIPDSWFWVRLGDALIIERGGSPRPIKDFITNDPNGINWIKIGDTEKGGKYINATQERIIPEGMKKSRYVQKGDFLLSNSMSFGRPYILNIDGCIHDGWLVLRPVLELFDKDYLYYLLSSPMVFAQFCSRVAGAVVNNLNSDKVALTVVPVPPLAEQKRIVAKLEEILPLCERLK